MMQPAVMSPLKIPRATRSHYADDRPLCDYAGNLATEAERAARRLPGGALDVIDASDGSDAACQLPREPVVAPSPIDPILADVADSVLHVAGVSTAIIPVVLRPIPEVSLAGTHLLLLP